MRRDIVVLHGGHVSELEKSGAAGRVFADSVLDSHVHDPGNAQVVYLEGQDETVAKGSSVAARQGGRHYRGNGHDRETVRRERTGGHSGHHLGAAEAQTLEAAAHRAGLDAVPANVWHQRGDILHRANLPGTSHDRSIDRSVYPSSSALLSS